MNKEYLNRELTLNIFGDQELPDEIEQAIEVIDSYLDSTISVSGISEEWVGDDIAETFKVVRNKVKLHKGKFDYLQVVLGYTENPFPVDEIEEVIKILTEFCLEKDDKYLDTRIYRIIKECERVERLPSKFAEMMGGRPLGRTL